jgi:hypothetical protein
LCTFFGSQLFRFSDFVFSRSPSRFLFQDPTLENLSYFQIQRTIEKVFISGSDQKKTEEETQIVNKMLKSQTFTKMADEFIEHHLVKQIRFGSVNVTKWHAIWEADLADENR